MASAEASSWKWAQVLEESIIETAVLPTPALDSAFAQALEETLREWESAADDAAFKDLGFESANG